MTDGTIRLNSPDPSNPIKITEHQIEHCARITHAANSALCEFNGEKSLPWKDVRDSGIAGVKGLLENPAMTPEENHNQWMAYRQKEGWQLGPHKDPVAKTHPCLVPYNMLPREQQLKDEMFRVIVKAFFSLP